MTIRYYSWWKSYYQKDEDVEKRELCTCQWEWKYIEIINNSMETPQNLKNRIKLKLPYDSTFPLLDINTKEIKLVENISALHVCFDNIRNRHNMNSAQVSINE